MKRGITIELRSGNVTFLPLTLGQIQDLEPEIALINNMDELRSAPFSKERMGALLKLATASAQAGNQQITEDELRNSIDVTDIPEVMKAIYGQSGFKEVPGGDQTHPTSRLTGGESTPASSAQPVGNGAMSTN